MIKAWLESAGGPWVVLAKVAIAGLLIAAITSGIAWLRADAASDATAACEAKFSNMVSQVALDEMQRRAELAEARYRAQAVLRRAREVQVSELMTSINEYERELSLQENDDAEASEPKCPCRNSDADVDFLLELRRRAH